MPDPLFFCFSPSGWDNEKKISILHENFQTLKSDDTFEDVVVKPPVRKVGALQGLGCGDEDILLPQDILRELSLELCLMSEHQSRLFLVARLCTRRRFRQKTTRCF